MKFHNFYKSFIKYTCKNKNSFFANKIYSSNSKNNIKRKFNFTADDLVDNIMYFEVEIVALDLKDSDKKGCEILKDKLLKNVFKTYNIDEKGPLGMMLSDDLFGSDESNKIETSENDVSKEKNIAEKSIEKNSAEKSLEKKAKRNHETINKFDSWNSYRKYYKYYSKKIYIHFIYDTEATKRRNINQIYYAPTIDVSQWWATHDNQITRDELLAKGSLEIDFEFDVYSATYYSWQNKYLPLEQPQNISKELTDLSVHNFLKNMQIYNNIYYLMLVFGVNILHSLFSMLAIKNDYTYWKDLADKKGLSLFTLTSEFVKDTVTVLYLHDKQASFVIVAQSFVSWCLSFWKLRKMIPVKKAETKLFWIIPIYKFTFDETYEKTTKGIEGGITKVLSLMAVPQFFIYIFYKAYYSNITSYYSFILQTAMGFIYIFGFIDMTPQLYINYKLKSVEHLPWRVMVYKFLNTIIDDLFAFTIKMPNQQRLSMFRDDIIFVIYLYQRRIYSVDKNRTEFGFVEGSSNNEKNPEICQDTSNDQKKQEEISCKQNKKSIEEKKLK